MTEKAFIVLHGVIATPPMSTEARVEAGTLLRRVQSGETLSMPRSRPMPSIGKRVHELRIPDGDVTWRVVYRIDPDAVVVGEVFAKKTRKTPKSVVVACQARFKAYDAL